MAGLYPELWILIRKDFWELGVDLTGLVMKTRQV
jgi:hypothetical protein